jgi:hypothetical protein
MSGGGQTQTTSQTKEPYGPSMPYLNDIMAQSQNLYNSGAGGQTWNGPLQAPMSAATHGGIDQTIIAANGMAGTASQPYNYAQGLIQNNGLTSAYNSPLSTYGNIASGQNGITTGGQFGDIASAAGQPTASSQYLTSLANGSQANNPYLQQMLDANDARIANRVNSSVAGMGRYGSGGHTQVLTDSLAAANNPVLAQAYSDQQNRQLAATSQIDAAQRAAQATQLGALQGQTGVQGQNISNQLAGAQGQTGIANFGQQNAANWAGMIPQLQSSAYAPGQALLGVGGLSDAYSQQNIDAQRQLFEQQQAQPWTQLNRYLGGVSGLGGLLQGTGTSTGNAQVENNPGFLDYAKLFAGGGNSAAAGGASAGLGILGFLSDRNEKTDIKKLGKDETTGLDLYAYRYKGDPKFYPKIVGPMAQDIEKAAPGSTDRVSGKLYVKAEALGILGLMKKAA